MYEGDDMFDRYMQEDLADGSYRRILGAKDSAEE